MASLQRHQLLVISVASIPVAAGVLNGLYVPLLYRASPALFWLIDVTSFVVIPLAITYWLANSANILPRHYGLQASLSGETLISSLFLGALLFGLYFVSQTVAWAFTWRSYVQPEFTYGSALPQGIVRLPAVLYMSLSAGLMESVFMLALPWFLWRNYLNLSHRRTLFALLSSAVFAVVHWEQGLHNMIAAFVFAYAACFLYWKLNDLWPIVGAHAVVDVIKLS
jgi:hypothetical protein